MLDKAPEKLPSAPELGEIATTRDGRDITRGYLSPMQRLEPLDPILRARGGGNLALYDEVLRDEQVKMALDQRRLAVTSRDFEVEPADENSAADKRAADALKANLEGIEWDRITDRMLYGVFYGFAVGECMWRRDGAQVVLDDVIVRDRRRFCFDGAMRLRLLTSADASVGEELPPGKFWRFCTGVSHDDEPYGLGLAHWLYWPVFFKRNGLKLWLTFLDKFGQPTAKGTYPPSASDEDRKKLLGALSAISTDSGIAVPEGMVIELLEAARSGTGDYSALFDKMNDAISKAVLGQVMTSEAKGGQYKSEVQMDVRQDIVKADADMVCMSFSRQVARWLTAWNFPGANPPRVWRVIDEGEDINDAADRDAKLNTFGFRPTLERVEEVYGDGYEPVAEPDPRAGKGEGENGKGKKPVVPAKAGTQEGVEFYDPEQPRVPAGAPEGGQFSRDSFTVTRLNPETGQIDEVIFRRGEYVKAWMSTDNWSDGEIKGISHARGEFSVNGVWHPFGAAYKGARPAPTQSAKKRAKLSALVAESNRVHGSGLTDADRVPEALQRGIRFAEPSTRFPDQDAVDHAISSITPAQQQSEIEPAIAPLIALIEAGESYEQILGKLAETWPAMDTADLQERLSRAWFAFETFGRLSAKAGA